MIEVAKPDVLITDIKMPFMDGLQLSKIIRKHMPWIKIIILSGHNEFEYAQSAVKLGLTEYLLKPVSAQDLLDVLKNLSAQLDRENREREALKDLQLKATDSLALTREKFLLKLVMGGISSADAIDQSQQLGLNIIARNYLVGLSQVELCDDIQPFDYHKYESVRKIVSDFVGNNPDVLFTSKDLGELVFLMKGETPEQLIQDGEFLAELITKQVQRHTSCKVVMELGSPQQHLGDIHFSFAEALARTKRSSIGSVKSGEWLENDLIKFDRMRIKNYLKLGSISRFNEFYVTELESVIRLIEQSHYIKDYLSIDLILTIAQFISDLGGEVEDVIPEFHKIATKLPEINTSDEFANEIQILFTKALSYRNNKVNHEQFALIQQAKDYIDNHFGEPALRMEDVAQRCNLSPSHFSTVFSRELGESFRTYLGNLRITKAKVILKTSNLKCADVAYQCGYNDPHYFSFVFKKKTGQSPHQFRTQSKDT